MTSQQQQQRPGRKSPPLNAHEAALVGALTAFAKGPVATKSPNRVGAIQSIVKPAAPASAKPVLGRKPSHLGKSTDSTAGTPQAIPRGSGSIKKAWLRSEEEDGTDHLHTEAPRQKNSAPHAVDLAKRAENVPPAQVRVTSNGGPSILPSRTGIAQRDEGGHERAPSTSSLVQMFESKGTTTAAVRLDTPLRSPKAMRRSLVLDQDDRTVASHLPDAEVETIKTVPTALPNRHVSNKSTVSSIELFKSAHNVQPQPALQKQHATTPALPPRQAFVQASTLAEEDAPGSQPESQSLPNHLHPPYMHAHATASTASIQATYNSLHPRRMQALRTGESLADAIVASSLASSRAPSPSKPTSQPPMLRKKHSHHSIFARTPSPNKIKPQSTGGLAKRTLRKETSTSAEDDAVLEDDPYYKHKRKRHLHKHANKYNEGDRKRWRNAVTETERNRYEGVWAANRGLLANLPAAQGSLSNAQLRPRPAKRASSWRDDERTLLYGSSSDGNMPCASPDQSHQNQRQQHMEHSEDVHAFIVRDLWHRSRLPDHVLEEIWALVNNGGATSASDERKGWLSKEEFVVGMWLVDQQLKGRKLPLRVSDSVWDSVRLLKGIKIRTGRKGW